MKEPLKVNRRGDRRGMSSDSQRNLKKFQKGQVTNPHGRPPKECCVTSILQKKLNQPSDPDPSMTWAEWLAKRALQLAGENPAYYRELMDRTEGRVPQALDARIAQQEDVVVYFRIGKGYVSKEEFDELDKVEEAQPKTLSAPAQVEPAKPPEQTASVKIRNEREGLMRSYEF